GREHALGRERPPRGVEDPGVDLALLGVEEREDVAAARRPRQRRQRRDEDEGLSEREAQALRGGEPHAEPGERAGPGAAGDARERGGGDRGAAPPVVDERQGRLPGRLPPPGPPTRR